jgi:hypothetical protein
MEFAIVLAIPVLLLVIPLTLGVLEEVAIARNERASKIRMLLDSADADSIEAEFQEILPEGMRPENARRSGIA